jgi:hypothetical protein
LNADVQTVKETVRNKDGQTAVRSAKLIVAFRNFAEGSKNNFGLAHILCKKTKINTHWKW